MGRGASIINILDPIFIQNLEFLYNWTEIQQKRVWQYDRITKRK